jgi:uncharacterized protein YoxC
MSVPAIYLNRINPGFNALDGINQQVNDLSHFVYTLSGSVQQLILNDLSDELYDLSNRTDLLQSDLTSLELRVDGISQEVDIILPDVLGLSGRVEGLSLELDTIQNDFSELSGDVYILESQVLTLSGYVYNLPAPTTPTIQQVLTSGNNANGIGIVNLGNTAIGKASASYPLDVSGDTNTNNLLIVNNNQIGSSSLLQPILTNYRRVSMGGGNSAGHLFGAFNGLGDGVHMSYNGYYQDNSGWVINNPSGQVSMVSVGYGQVKLSTGPTNTAPTTRLMVLNNGNVGIGTTNPQVVCDVSGNARVMGNFGINKTATTSLDILGNLNMVSGVRANTHPTGLPFYVTGFIEAESSGFQFGHNNGTTGVGIGFNSIYMTGNGANLPMNITTKGTGAIFFRPGATTRAQINQDGTINFNNYANGTLSITTGGLVVSSSDKRAKKNIEYIDLSGLELVNKIKPAKFQYNHEEHDFHTGFIADQLIEAGLGFCVDGKKYEYELMTEDVSGENFYDRKTIIKLNEDGTPMLDYSKPRMKGLDHSGLIAILVKAVQELSKEVNDLKARLP